LAVLVSPQYLSTKQEHELSVDACKAISKGFKRLEKIFRGSRCELSDMAVMDFFDFPPNDFSSDKDDLKEAAILKSWMDELSSSSK
jgi:hypothetical protein